MADLKTPFRYDYVGSFLRPEALKQARKNFEEGKITKEEAGETTATKQGSVVIKYVTTGWKNQKAGISCDHRR